MTDERISADEVRELIALNEGQTVEFKLESETQPDLAEVLAALANAEGGTILIGVGDDRALVGVGDVKTITLRVLAAARSVTPRLDETVTVDEVVVDGYRIVAVRVPADLTATFLAGSSYRIRHGAQNVLMSVQAIVEHTRRRGAIPFDRETVAGSGAGDLDPARLGEFLRRRGGASGATLAQLRNLHATAKAPGGDMATVAGLLMFGREPQRFLPQAVLQCARFLGSGVSRFLDRVELLGTLDEQIGAGMDFVARNIRHGTYFAGVQHVDVDEYPLTAIREALINALCHRDYYASNTTVNLSIFDDRIEILNPGGLLPGLSVDDLEGAHRLRNSALGQLMYEAGLIERWGSGIRRMRLSMAELNLAPPAIQASRDWFRIVFYGPGAAFLGAAPERSAAVEDLGATAAVLNRLNGRQRRLLLDLRERGSITRVEYEQHYGVARASANRDLIALVELGLLRREGDSRAARYLLARPE